jgi:hypothetical protein
MAQRKPYYGQIPQQRNFFGKRYYHHTHSTNLQHLDDAEKEFKKVYGDRFSFHRTTQMVTPPGTKIKIKMHVLYTRDRK